MASKEKAAQNIPKEANDENIAKNKKRGRPTKGSRCNSQNTSRNNSPMVSPNKYSMLVPDSEGDDIWACKVCCGTFSDPDDKLLECQRCRDHFCIGCLGKTVEEYNLMSKSDMMWFCVECRERVEKNIITDRKIEETCREMARKFEERIKNLEKSLSEKCSKEEVIAVVQEELEKQSKQGNVERKELDNENQLKPNLNEVMEELNERKSREANIVIYGIEECESTSRDVRIQKDMTAVEEIVRVCDEEILEESIVKVVRLGKYDKEKQKRPLLVKFCTTESKTKLFKGIKKLTEQEKFRNIRIANDLTKNGERKREENAGTS